MPDAETALARKFEVLSRVLDERTRRLVAAAEAEAIGFGGVTAVAHASGLSRGTVIRGMAELKVAPKPARGQRIRRRGAGRVSRSLAHSEYVIEPEWKCQSTRARRARSGRKLRLNCADCLPRHAAQRGCPVLELRSLQRKPTSAVRLHEARSHNRPAAHGTTILAAAVEWCTHIRAGQ
jgi:hypothetical protein